eukprot:5753126-Pyramimonas_sp.AAC.1
MEALLSSPPARTHNWFGARTLKHNSPVLFCNTCGSYMQGNRAPPALQAACQHPKPRQLALLRRRKLPWPRGVDFCTPWPLAGAAE